MCFLYVENPPNIIHNYVEVKVSDEAVDLEGKLHAKLLTKNKFVLPPTQISLLKVGFMTN